MPQTDKGVIIGSIIGGICAIIAPILVLYINNNAGNNANRETVNANSAINKNRNQPEQKKNDGKPNQPPMVTEGLTISLTRTRDDKVGSAQLSDVFVQGDGLRFNISAAEKGFIYIFHRGSDGESKLFFPDGKIKPEQNQVNAEQTLTIPSDGWWFLDENKGLEKIYIIYSRTGELTIGKDEIAGRDLTAHDDGKAVVDYLERIRARISKDVFTTSNGNLVRAISLVHQ
jgi:hypothetical protein